MKTFLTAQEIKILQDLHRQSTNRKHADRIKTILLLNKGYTYEEVAEFLLLDDSTIRRYHKNYQGGGFKRLLLNRNRGKQPNLNANQIKFLRLHLRIRIYTQSAKIADYIRDRFGVEYQDRGVRELLKRMGFVYKKPKVVPGKANAESQKQFLLEYEELMATKSEADTVYFADGCHPHHNAIPAYGWIEKGVEKQLKTNSGRQRINLNGVLNAEDVTDVEILSEETINADAVIRMLELLLVKHAIGNIYLILDNARYYRAKKVTEFIQANPRIKLQFLPPYSPNLNKIERLWLYFQKHILYNRYYKDVKEFEKESLKFFTNLNAHKKQLNSLITDNFQIVAIE